MTYEFVVLLRFVSSRYQKLNLNQCTHIYIVFCKLNRNAYTTGVIRLMCLFHKKKIPRDDVPANFVRLTSLTTSFCYHAEFLFFISMWFQITAVPIRFSGYSPNQKATTPFQHIPDSRKMRMGHRIICAQNISFDDLFLFFICRFAKTNTTIDMPWSLEFILIFASSLCSVFGIQCFDNDIVIYWNG